MRMSKEWKIVISYSVFILIVSVLPVKESKISEFFPLDKLTHFLLYFMLAVFCVRAFKGSLRIYLKSFTYAFCWGAFIEATQHLLPYRSFDVMDLLCNSLGSLCGVLLSYKLLSKVLNE